MQYNLSLFIITLKILERWEILESIADSMARNASPSFISCLASLPNCEKLRKTAVDVRVSLSGKLIKFQPLISHSSGQA